MSIEKLIKDDLFQKFGMSAIFIATSFIVYTEMMKQVDSRLKAQDARIQELSTQVSFFTGYLDREQDQRKDLLEGISSHLQAISK